MRLRAIGVELLTGALEDNLILNFTIKDIFHVKHRSLLWIARVFID